MKRILMLSLLFLGTYVSAQNNGLPPGVIVTASGLVCVGAGNVCNPTGLLTAADVGTWTFSKTACDSEQPPVCSPSTNISVTIITTTGCVISISPTVLNPGQVGKPYTQKLTADANSSCVAPYVFQ